MKRSDFRVKEYRGKFYIERRLKKEIHYYSNFVDMLLYRRKYRIIITWERVDDYGNHVTIPEYRNTLGYVKELNRYLGRRLEHFKTLAKAKKKIEEFFKEPKYHYIK